MSLVARVVPDVTGVDKVFDYLIPSELQDAIAIGDRVRVPLHGRGKLFPGLSRGQKKDLCMTSTSLLYSWHGIDANGTPIVPFHAGETLGWRFTG